MSLAALNNKRVFAMSLEQLSGERGALIRDRPLVSFGFPRQGLESEGIGGSPCELRDAHK